MNIDEKIRQVHKEDMMDVKEFRPWSDAMWDELDQSDGCPQEGDVVLVTLHGAILPVRVIHVLPHRLTFVVMSPLGTHTLVSVDQIVEQKVQEES
jgi:hypothetical protein